MNEQDSNIPQESEIKELVHKLCEGDRAKHEEIRKKLISYGPVILRYVKVLLNNQKHHCRWEAMKLMEETGDPESIPFFLDALEDEKGDIRWIAAEGLIATHEFSVKQLLKLLLEKSDSVFVLNAAHHVFSELKETHRLPENFPSEKLLPLLKKSGIEIKLKLIVHEALNKMNN